MKTDRSAPEIVVVGAGAFGGWTALHLRRQGARVTLVDAWGAGHSRSSSGGESRLLRAVYGADRIYTEMALRALGQFRDLEKKAGTRLIRETGALWMFSGDDSFMTDALPILDDTGVEIEPLGIDEAARRWRQVSFADVDSVYLEPAAAVLSARRICQEVRDRFVAAGGVFRTLHVRAGAVRDGRMAAIDSHEGERLEGDSFIFCCGPWLGEMFADVVGQAVRPSRQEVYFFGPPAGCTDFEVGRLPAWIDFGDRESYGFPSLSDRGLKFADDTRGEPFDPTSGDRLPTESEVRRAREFLARRFPALSGAPLIEARVCQYENSPDGHLIVDRHPDADNCWIVGGGSGHGFKLGPAVGELVAGCVLSAADLEPRFRLARFAEGGQPRARVE